GGRQKAPDQCGFDLGLGNPKAKPWIHNRVRFGNEVVEETNLTILKLLLYEGRVLISQDFLQSELGHLAKQHASHDFWDFPGLMSFKGDRYTDPGRWCNTQPAFAAFMEKIAAKVKHFNADIRQAVADLPKA